MGVELTYVVEKRTVLLEVQRERATDLHAWRRRPMDCSPLAFCSPVMRVFRPASVTQIADAGVPRHHTQEALEVLEDAAMVHQPSLGQWLPAHPPSITRVRYCALGKVCRTRRIHGPKRAIGHPNATQT